ncbi:MAG: T9SS type A sorting domain-containing protein [Flavobacteriales bacterium]|nr:T9SS type A sorting domain-containing protein [Flavobacteriales bacterium]MBL6873218.1 T9SS type A sorting domain-containing protein [Flavobacteriales bacterium]
MKKTLLLLFVFSSYLLVAQNQLRFNQETKNDLNKHIIKIAKSISQSEIDCSDTTYLYCEDFESVSSPALPSNITTSSLETGYNVNVNSTNQQVSGFYTGDSDDANVGGYWPVTGHTQFAMTNDDACKPNGTTPNANNNCDLSFEVLELPLLDFTNQNDVFLIFDYYHDKNYGGGDAYVEYKIGSGSWTNISGNLPDGDAWQEGIFSLSALNNTDSVSIRFVWSDDNKWATGFAIDNIVVGELKDNELSLQTINQYIEGNTYASTYSQIPLSQQGNGFYFRQIIRNIGNNQQDSTRLKVEILSEQFETQSWAKNLSSLERDTFFGNNYFNATSIGDYQISFTSESDSTTTDAQTLDFKITDYIFARDIDEESIIFSLVSATGGQPTIEHGNTFSIKENTTLYAVDVFISQNSDPNGKIQAKVYLVDNGTANFIAESNRLSIPSLDSWQSVKFANPVSLDAGNEYLVTVGGDGTLSDTTRIGASSSINGSYGWRIYNGYSGTGSTPPSDGIYLSIPMVRMNLDPNVAGPIGIEEEDKFEFSIYPNPNNGMFNISLKNQPANNLDVVIKNVLGQIVHQDYINSNSSGSIDLNLQHLKKGVYIVDLLENNSISNTGKIIIK